MPVGERSKPVKVDKDATGSAVDDRPKRPTLDPDELGSHWLMFVALLLFRMLNALTIRTYYDPDEFWQSLEVAHRYAFGYGYLTWEWKEKIRGFAHPAIFAVVFKILRLTGLDTGQYVVLIPRLVQALFAAFADLYTYRLAHKLHGASTATWVLFCSVVSWYHFFCSVRTLSNSLETTLTVMALYYWPRMQKGQKGMGTNSRHAYRKALILAAMGCIVRPTNALIWMFLGMRLLKQCSGFRWQLTVDTLVVMICAVAASTLIDGMFYEELTFVPLNFVRHNLLDGIASFYGTHPWHWYLSQGYPVTAFTFLIPILWHASLSRFADLDKELLKLIGWVLAVYSMLPHKEFRFIYPILPPTLVCAGKALADLKRRAVRGGPKQQNLFALLCLMLVVTNAAMAYLFGRVHQRGVMDALGWLRERSQKTGAQVHVKDIVFMMPCHSTPYYGHIHAQIPMRFLTCEPPVRGTQATYVDEADMFYQDPRGFIRNRFHEGQILDYRTSNTNVSNSIQWPSHVVLFEALLPEVQDILVEKQYSECARFFNSYFHDDSRRKGDVVIYCR
ncbi:hypothetical protein HDU85_000477 [Gaertneriomyces sp. JEL0708]|nr:hypothetical protein HDU85_000477 [Gaertneriomyces sp. JEL0708]